MPYGRCVIYSFQGDGVEMVEKARAGMLPIFKKQSGFLAYGVILQGDQIVSMSAWNSETDAQSADEAAKDWVAQNVEMTPQTSVIGDFSWLEFAER
jgi:heme-degrading monooxygenase HmoA